MEKKKGKIGIKEYVATVILMMGTKVADDTPSILYHKLLNSAWMVPLFTGIISILPIYLLLKVLTSYKDKNLTDVIYHLCGKYFGFLVIFILWSIGLFALTVDSAIYVDIISTMYFTRTPPLIIYIVLMGVCAYGAKKGLEQIGSVAWSTILYIKISFFGALLLTLINGNPAYLTPIFGPGLQEIVKQSSLKLSIFADFIFLGLLLPFLTSAKDFKKGTWISLGILVFELTAAVVTYLLLFDFIPAKNLSYPFHEVIRYVQMGFLTNIETFFFPFWIVASFVRFSAYLYLNSLLFGALFKIKHFEYTIPTFAVIFIFFGLKPEAPTFTIFYLRETMLDITSPIFMLLPILLWILAKVKGDLRDAKTNK